MDEQLIALYHRHVGMAFDRQMRLAAFLHKKSASGAWEYDTTTAILTFDKVQFEAPILGSHASHNNSWLWAWSNKHLKLSITNRALGDTVRALVHRLNVHVLGAPAFALEPLLGPTLTQSAAHILGVILVGELGYDAYQAFPNDGSTELVLIRDDRLKFTEKHPLVRIATQFTELLRSMPVMDDKATLTAYAHHYGLTVTEQPNTLKITAGGKDELTATFDAQGRFAKFDGVAIPEPKPVKMAVKKKPAKKQAAAKAATKKAPAKKLAAKPKVAAKASKKPVKPAAKKPTKKR
ncbi:MAG: hypothetical protein K8U57_26020 [Planctomycetes bacterium]|nr:hypothetical protein [Planctomycetota bacterium]